MRAPQQATAVHGTVRLTNPAITGNARYQISKDLASGVNVIGASPIPISIVRP